MQLAGKAPIDEVSVSGWLRDLWTESGELIPALADADHTSSRQLVLYF